MEQFLHRDDRKTVYPVEDPSLGLSTMPRPLQMSPNHTMLKMRTWLNGWIHFYATNADEDRANRLRNFQRLFIEVPLTKLTPTSSSSDYEDTLDEDEATDEAVNLGQTSFEDELLADVGLRHDPKPRPDSTNPGLSNVSNAPNIHHPYQEPGQRRPAEEARITMNATPLLTDAPVDRRENERRDYLKLTWKQMREKHGMKGACQDLTQESEVLEKKKSPNSAIVVSVLHS